MLSIGATHVSFKEIIQITCGSGFIIVLLVSKKQSTGIPVCYKAIEVVHQLAGNLKSHAN